MTNVHSFSDTPTREVYLLENVSIQGRKTELRQLLKLLNLAKTGQPKTALITGDAGIGKTALLEAFTKLVREGVYCRIVDLGRMTYATPEAIYVALIDTLRAEADSILDDALVAVNEITRELDLRWERPDLVRAIALVKLQESIGGKEAVRQEQLVKAIRSQVPAIKKLRFSLNEKIEKLVDLLVNPWVMVATSLLSPMHPPLQEAIRLADRLKAASESSAASAPASSEGFSDATNGASDPMHESGFGLKNGSKNGNSLINRLANDSDRASGNGATAYSLSQIENGLPFPPETTPKGRESLEPPLGEGIVSAPRPVRHIPAVDESTAPLTHAVALPPLDDALFAGGTASSGLTHPGAFERPSGSVFDRTSGNPLVQHLMTVLDFINAAIENMDSALLIVLDEWDRILHQPEREAIKEFFAEWLSRLTERKNAHLMLVMAARTEGESYTLGGAIYNHFRTKLLLDPLGEVVCRKWSRSVMQNTEISEEVNRRLFRLSKGSPYWHFKALHYMRERLESNRMKHADVAFFDKLGIDAVESLPELGFTCLKLTFLNDEDALYKVIAALIKHFGENAFSVNEAIRELSPAQGFTDGYVFEVLRALFRHDFIRQISVESAAPGPESAPSARQQPSEEPRYAIQGRLMLAFLQEKTRAIETDISADEKLAYLKKIIPLSIKSGDLDREKTMEILALGDALGYPEIVSFLENLFVEALQDEKAIVRVTALNNMALIDSARARDALLSAMRDEHSMVREAVVDNLALLSRKNTDPVLAERIIDVLIRCIDDESDMVRTQVYGILSRYRGQRDLTTVFVKGLADACESVRLIAVRNLAELDTDSPYAFGGLLDAVGDSVADIRRYACIGLQKYPVAEAIEAIARMLRQDPHSGIRALAADTLSRMEDGRAFPALVTALRTETAEDVKLAVVRALGKRRDWQSEAVLQDALKTADSEAMPVFVWAGVRSLGQVGGSDRSLELLGELQRRIDNPIILSALERAQRMIRERLSELQQRRHPMGEGSSLTVPLSASDEEEDITLPEEEMLPS